MVIEWGFHFLALVIVFWRGQSEYGGHVFGGIIHANLLDFGHGALGEKGQNFLGGSILGPISDRGLGDNFFGPTSPVARPIDGHWCRIFWRTFFGN